MPDKKYNSAKATKKTSKPSMPVSARSSSSTKASVRKTNTTRRVRNNVSRRIRRKAAPTLLTAIIVCLVIGLFLGALSIFFVTKNDCFEMVTYSNEEVDIYIGGEENFDEYIELGVKCIAFGKDISNQVKITYMYREDISQDAIVVESIDTSVNGIYYVIYSSSNFKYKNIELIRNVIVLREED